MSDNGSYAESCTSSCQIGSGYLPTRCKIEGGASCSQPLAWLHLLEGLGRRDLGFQWTSAIHTRTQPANSALCPQQVCASVHVCILRFCAEVGLHTKRTIRKMLYSACSQTSIGFLSASSCVFRASHHMKIFTCEALNLDPKTVKSSKPPMFALLS